jgi:hypothetical protein
MSVQPSLVHLNGSVNLPDAETVMREITSRVPVGVRRIPDGETGDRGNWIVILFDKFLRSPWFETATPRDPAGGNKSLPQLRLADGTRAADVEWPSPGYAQAYAGSYATFRKLQEDGVIRPETRFQAEYPTPFACMSRIADGDLGALRRSFERVLFADLASFLAAVPDEEVAVQWDVAIEFGMLEGCPPDARSGLIRSVAADVARCLDQVPAGVPCGLHLCYGDYRHRHFTQPGSLELQLVSFASFTVPQDRQDPEYFAPLTALAAGPETELYFSLVPYHPADQAPGTTARQVAQIDAALSASPAGARAWGICTECGMGRVHRDDIPALLDLHSKIIAAH